MCYGFVVVVLFCFAGSLGISRQMEGLVSEVSIITEAGEDSAPSWPLAQLQHVSPALVGSRMFPRFVSDLVCVAIQLILCLPARVRMPVLVILSPAGMSQSPL